LLTIRASRVRHRAMLALGHWRRALNGCALGRSRPTISFLVWSPGGATPVGTLTIDARLEHGTPVRRLSDGSRRSKR